MILYYNNRKDFKEAMKCFLQNDYEILIDIDELKINVLGDINVQ